jgi:hypothetical protein
MRRIVMTAGILDGHCWASVGNVVLAHRPKHLRLARRVFTCVRKDRREATLKERILDRRRELGEEGVLQIAHDHPDKIG